MVRQRVTFQRRDSAVDDTGQISATWNDLYQVGAKITKLAQTETSSNPREVSYSSYIVTVPYSPNSLMITTRDAAVFNGTRYTIESVDTTSAWRKSVKILVSQRNEENS